MPFLEKEIDGDLGTTHRDIEGGYPLCDDTREQDQTFCMNGLDGVLGVSMKFINHMSSRPSSHRIPLDTRTGNSSSISRDIRKEQGGIDRGGQRNWGKGASSYTL